MVWVKICGTTNLEDAQAAVDAGADALGFVFAESPRRVAPVVARQITRALPEHVEKIGVFVNETAGRIGEIVEEAGLTAVQLHGDETPDLVDRVAQQVARVRPLRVIPALSMERIRHMAMVDGLIIKFPPFIDTLLVDSAGQGKRGGTGETWDWELGKAVVELLGNMVQVVVAGGLTPANVRDAIRTLRPWGVDVVSGVEREPGNKDHEKIRAFVKAAKSAA
jgi:phosphoribosylanthranilate isomerase